MTSSKQNAIVDKVNLVSDELKQLESLSGADIVSVIHHVSGMEQTRFLITDHTGLVIYDSAAEEDDFTQHDASSHIQSALRGEQVFICRYEDSVLYSEAAVPLHGPGTFSGCVYMMETDATTGQLLKMLQAGIFTITMIMEILLVIFSLMYAHKFSRRLRKIMVSMDIIQDGHYDHKVQLGGHDELTILGEEFNELTERLNISENKRRQFVSDASHELKTPLASIKLLSDSILQYDMDMDTIKEFVGDIGNEADRLTRMTGKLLELTKGERNSDLSDAEIIYMAPTIRRVIKMLSGIAKENNITIEADLSVDSQVLIQEDDLYQIAFNLAENGIKYNIPGGKLSISLHQQDDNGILRVSDTGMGIPPEAIGHVFERFYRVDKARSRQSGGSGLGLAIVRSIVERNNGQIHLQSTLGKGTVFTVEFPRFDIEDEQGEEEE